MKSEIRLRVWIEKKDLPFLGPGRIQLLEEIMTQGSIAKAASSLGMSYRKAWQLINDMNNISNVEIVTRSVGGSKGGGAEVTKKGKELINNYRKVQKEADKLLLKFSELFNFE